MTNSNIIQVVKSVIANMTALSSVISLPVLSVGFAGTLVIWLEIVPIARKAKIGATMDLGIVDSVLSKVEMMLTVRWR